MRIEFGQLLQDPNKILELTLRNITMATKGSKQKTRSVYARQVSYLLYYEIYMMTMQYNRYSRCSSL